MFKTPSSTSRFPRISQQPSPFAKDETAEEALIADAAAKLGVENASLEGTVKAAYRANWGARTNAYVARVGSQLDAARDKALNNDFAKWMTANPASGPAAAATAGMSPTQSAMAQDFSAWAAGAGQIPGTPTPERAPVSQLRPAAAPAAPGIVDQAGTSTRYRLTFKDGDLTSRAREAQGARQPSQTRTHNHNVVGGTFNCSRGAS
jgi:hypothetical protein